MKGALAWLLLALSFLWSASAWAEDPLRVALIVGTNVALDKNLPPLRYADDDAAKYDELFRLVDAKTIVLSRFDDNTSRLYGATAARVRPPLRAELDRAIAELGTEVAAARAAGHPTEAYFVYAGHGGAQDGRGYVTLEDARLVGDDIARAVLRIGADRVHVIVDACDSTLLAQGRGPGGERRAVQGFRESGPLSENPRVGLLLSTTRTRESHEWDQVEAGVFSHEVRSGLYGAADADGDGLVTYRELAAFVARANQAIPSERFRPEVQARPPSGSDVLLDLRSKLSGARIEVGRGASFHYFVEDTRGVRVLDFHNGPRSVVSVLRPAPGERLYVHQADTDVEFQVEGDRSIAALAQMSPEAPRFATRGAEQDAYSLLFSLPFDESVVEAYAPPPGPERPVSQSRTWRKPAGIVAVVAGGAGLAVGASLGVAAAIDSAGASSSDTQFDALRRNDRVSALRTGAIVGLAAGAVVLGGGIVLLSIPASPAGASNAPAGRWQVIGGPLAGGGQGSLRMSF